MIHKHCPRTPWHIMRVFLWLCFWAIPQPAAGWKRTDCTLLWCLDWKPDPGNGRIKCANNFGSYEDQGLKMFKVFQNPHCQKKQNESQMSMTQLLYNMYILSLKNRKNACSCWFLSGAPSSPKLCPTPPWTPQLLVQFSWPWNKTLSGIWSKTTGMGPKINSCIHVQWMWMTIL